MDEPRPAVRVNTVPFGATEFYGKVLCKCNSSCISVPRLSSLVDGMTILHERQRDCLSSTSQHTNR
jgi:hypothetical protein